MKKRENTGLNQYGKCQVYTTGPFRPSRQTVNHYITVAQWYTVYRLLRLIYSPQHLHGKGVSRTIIVKPQRRGHNSRNNIAITDLNVSGDVFIFIVLNLIGPARVKFIIICLVYLIVSAHGLQWAFHSIDRDPAVHCTVAVLSLI